MDNKNKRIPYATWNVDGIEYKLKLTVGEITKLEEQLRTNLINVINSTNGIPALKIMIAITHGAIQKYHHGLKLKEVETLFGKYIDEGGSQLEFMTDVLIPIYQASGFFSGSVAEEMNESLETAKEQL